jgi:hypothetical protein
MDQTSQLEQKTSEKQQETTKNIVISPIQLLVNATLVAYQRGAFTMKETSLISQAIDYFTVETKQAVIPEINNNKQENDKKETINNEKVIFQSQ